VFGVTAVLPIAWGSSAVFLQQQREVTSYYSTFSDDPGAQRCTAETRTEQVPRIDLSMPLLWGNPVVLLAETAPPVPEDIWRHEEENLDVLRLVKSGVRAAATITHPALNNHCEPDQAGYPADLGAPPNRPVWPMGLGLWLLAGGASPAAAVRRLGAPIRRLGAGTLDRRPTGGPVDGTAPRARPPRGTPDPNRSAAPVPQFAERVGDVVGRADELRRPLPAAGEGRALAAEVGQGAAGEVRLA